MSKDESAVVLLQRRLGVEWPAIRRAQEQTLQTRTRLCALVEDLRLCDTALVGYGSLAREEWTGQSDVDWTLLVDGRADPQHIRTAKEVEKRLAEGLFNKPGPTGVFGNMTFSHDLFNKIGGIEDSNENTTQRILLLLESRALCGADTYERVVRLILGRYLDDDRGLLYGRQPHKVPRYLVNDVVRYWRTIAVDFVDKQRGRSGKGWALRNAKLKLSRKLIFVSGLLTCFGCELFSPREARDALSGSDHSTTLMVEHLRGFVARTPLDILCHALLRLDVRPDTARELLDVYDAFLAVLDDDGKRRRLSDLRQDELSGDSVFREVSILGRRFQDALTAMFFRQDPKLAEMTMTYGVF